MAEVKFGAKQISKPTPANVNLAVRVFTVIAGIFMGWMSTNDLIGPNTQGHISSILGLLLALVNGLAPLFGVQITSGTVKAEDVTAIQSDNSKTN